MFNLMNGMRMCHSSANLVIEIICMCRFIGSGQFCIKACYGNATQPYCNKFVWSVLLFPHIH